MQLLRRRRTHDTDTDAATTDARLVAWAQQSPQAFTALYDRYYPAVHGYCLTRLTDSDDADDAASQTFLRALAALPDYREAGRFRAWLFVIAHNAIADTARARRGDEPIAAAAAVYDRAASPEERAIATLDLERLERALARLAPGDRAVLDLRRAGLSGREIAEVLGIGFEAAKKRQLRAIDRLRLEIADTFDVGATRHGS